jgi:Mce-associated membrane protein
MSPRRKLEPSDEVVESATVVKPRRWGVSRLRWGVPRLRWRVPRRGWGLPVVSGLAALLIAGAIAVSTLMLISHESHRRAEIKDAVVLSYVRQFMTGYTSLDPFRANDYADWVLARGTGDFAKQFKDRMNQVVVQVARAEPTSGTVQEAGVEKWYDDGSVSVLVATKITTTTPDGKTRVETGSRWVARAIEEGQQWKISQLMQVI